MIRKLAIIYGLGGGWLDPRGGEDYLLSRCKAAGFYVPAIPFDYANSQGILNWLKDADWRGLIGDSAGATFAGQYAQSIAPLKLDYLAGFQPSADMGIGSTISIPTNVVYAHVIRDPDWIDTAGLGWATWVVSKPTMLVETDHRGAHPDDFGAMQDLIFAEVKQKAGL
jgi:hypothetical protein